MEREHEDEFRRFVAARSATLFRTAFLLTGHREQAEDLLQTVLARIAQHWPRLRTSDDLEAYVRKALYHQQVGRWRLRSWRREVTTDAVPERPDPGDPLGAVDARVTLADALDLLPPRQRAVLVLRFYEDLTESQIADVLDVSIGTVRSQGHRAVTRLRELRPDLVRSEEAAR